MMMFTVGMGIMAVGALIAVFGVLFLLNHGTFVKIILGVLISAAGLGVLGIGYTVDQRTKVEYTVTDCTRVSTKEPGKNIYRVTLSYGDNAQTIIYIEEKYADKFAKDNQLTMMKKELKYYNQGQ